ncbi:MAG: metal ABC transporter ATP-binding protein [Candidatus Micrarchaeota archaeon]
MAKDVKVLIELKNVCFSYGKHRILKDIDLKVMRGDFVGMIGPNGAGKTTLLKIMLGLLKPDSGQLIIFGKDSKTFNEKHRVGYVPQKATNFDQNFPATVFEVASMGRFAKIGFFKPLSKSDLGAIEKSLKLVGMLEHKDSMIGSLSGGQQQRVFIARALAGEPELLLLDEPTVGVDEASQKMFYDILDSLNKKMGLTCILVSHDVGMVSTHVNKLACINQKLILHDVSKGLKHEDLMCPYPDVMKRVSHSHTHRH